MNMDFLNSAFFYARKAFDNNEVPIGAVIVKDNQIISYGYNLKESNHSVIDHAEINAIRAAEHEMSNWRLDNCDLYVTLDPCPMCASAIKQSRIKNVYSALSNSDSNNFKIISEIFETNDINSSVNFVSNLDVKRSKELLQAFFENQRNK